MTVGFIVGMQGWYNIMHHSNGMKEKKSSQLMQRKHLTKFSTFSYKSIKKKLGIGGNHLNTMKAMYKKPTAYVILNNERLRALPSRPGTKQ